MSKVPGNIENLENQAEQSLVDARKKAAEIISRANEESRRVLAETIDVSDIKKECNGIVELAKKNSEDMVNASKKQADDLKNTTGQKVDDIVQRITTMITEA